MNNNTPFQPTGTKMAAESTAEARPRLLHPLCCHWHKHGHMH